MLDIARDPRWGRVVEGAGEDPYLGSAMAVAQMKGFQGDDLAAKDTMLATAKHFAGYGAVTAGRDYNAVDLPPRLFRDVYLPPFKAVADAKSEEHTSELQSLMRISYAVFCLKKKKNTTQP